MHRAEDSVGETIPLVGHKPRPLSARLNDDEYIHALV